MVACSTTMECRLVTLLSLLLAVLLTLTEAYPHSFLDLARTNVGERRTPEPYFPSYPPSCPICQQAYPNISSCAAACSVFANFSMVRVATIDLQHVHYIFPDHI